MHCTAAKFVPQLLTNHQKQHLVNVCLELGEKANDSTFISRIIMSDDSWIYGYVPQIKRQSSQWKSPQSPREKKARQVQSSTKGILIVFFDVKETVHHYNRPIKNDHQIYMYIVMYKLLAVITDDTGRKTGHSTCLR
jgi:hypothetical protein